MYGVRCTVYNVRCTVNGVPCTVYGVRCTVYSVLRTVYGVQCTVYGVRCTVYTEYSIVYGVRRTPYMVYGVRRYIVEQISRGISDITLLCKYCYVLNQNTIIIFEPKHHSVYWKVCLKHEYNEMKIEFYVY